MTLPASGDPAPWRRRHTGRAYRIDADAGGESSALLWADLALLLLAAWIRLPEPGAAAWCWALASTLAALVGFRACLAFGALSNEWAHVLVALAHGAGRRAWTAHNLLGHRPLAQHLRALVPGTRAAGGDLYVEIRGLSLAASQRVRRGGFWLSTLGLLGLMAAWYAHRAAGPLGLTEFACALALALTTLASFLTDLTRLTPYAALPGVMACGNLTLLGRLLPDETAAVPARVRTLLEIMLRVSQLRGAQSGGAAIKLRAGNDVRQHISKCVNGKRSDLAKQLTRRVARAGAARAAFGGSFLLQTHVRFATSGAVTREESHPFRFVEAQLFGPRRVFTPALAETQPALRCIETAITHNGDMDALHFRGVRLAHPDLGWFLERVLGAPNRWTGDSPALAGIFELFLTQGLWFESLRLAYLELAAPAPPDLSAQAGVRAGLERAQFVRACLLDYPAPSRALLMQFADLAEQVWLATAPGLKSRMVERSAAMERSVVATDLSNAFRQVPGAEDAAALREAFAQRSLELFLDNDLFRAARAIEAAVEGTFGCVATSTLEPDVAVAFVRGQPLSLGVQAETGLTAIVSERNALRVRDAAGRAVFDARLDFDLSRGEVARVALGPSLQPQIALYSVAERRIYTREELEVSGRLVSLRDNPLTEPLPLEPARRVRADLLEIPQLLRGVRSAFHDPGSHNRGTAEAFASTLLSAERPRLLVLGITNELWLAEQFVRNLRLCFPQITAEARSSNEVLKEFAGPLEAGTTVLAISQSGQDFPTLASVQLLRQRWAGPGRPPLFVLTGEPDTLLGQAVGQSYAKRANWNHRIFVNGGGYRPSEAATASVNACWATLCELVLFLAAWALERPAHQHGLCLDEHDLQALAERRDACVDRNAAAIVGGVADAQQTAQIARQITRQSRRWGWHLLEGVVAFAGAALVLELNLQFGGSFKPSGLLAWLPAQSAPWGWLGRGLALLATQADVLFYLFLTPLLLWALRALQRRPLLHRHGTRELLIGDTAYVRNIAWLLARRLFSLSYGFASIKPYAADNQDDLIMTHEPVRGTLALFGLPDLRRTHLSAHGQAALMTAKQFAGSRSLRGSGAEVVTLGHADAGLSAGTHLQLPRATLQLGGPTLDLLMEGMFDSWERLLALQVLLSQLAEAVAAFRFIGFDPSRTKDQVFAPTTASPVSAAHLALGSAGLSESMPRYSRVSLPFEVLSRNSRTSLLELVGLTRVSRAPAESLAQRKEEVFAAAVVTAPVRIVMGVIKTPDASE